MPAIVRELLNVVSHCHVSDRLRLAVSESEYEEIRQYCFERDKMFAGRIRAIPLIICKHPPIAFREFSPEVMPHA